MTDAPVPPTPGTSAAVPAPQPAQPGSATTLIWRRMDGATLRAALLAVGIAWAIEIVYQVFFIIEAFSYALTDGFGGIAESFGDFGFYGIWRALFFFAPAFLALWLFLPIVKESTLPKVMMRAAAAGVVGLAGLAFFGLIDGIVDAATFGSFEFGYFLNDLIWFPIVLALGFTVQLLLGAVVAWLRAQQAPKVVPAAPTATAPVAPPAPPAAPPAPPAAPPAPSA